MAVNALGPTLAGGSELYDDSGYGLMFLPDVNNDELQRNGKPAIFYWVPRMLRLARRDMSDAKPYLFNMIKFAGVKNPGGPPSEDDMVAGGLLTFSVTSAPPPGVMERLQQKLIEKFNGVQDYFWGIKSAVPPLFRPAIIMANTTSVSNVSPTPEGGVPVPDDGGGGTRAIGGYKTTGFLPAPRADVPMPRVRDIRTRADIDPWYWNMQGQGKGSIDAGATNAYSALLGAYPAEIVWQAFHGAASPIIVIQNLKLKMWSPAVELTIHAKWRRVFEHFSASLEGHYYFASVDLKAEFNKMRTEGAIEVDVKVDQSLPNADKLAEQIDKRTDLVYQHLMEMAKKTIFDVPQPQVQAADANSGSGPWGVGLALKWRRDTNEYEETYHETRQFAYLQEHTISSSLAGLSDEIAADAANEKKYFSMVYLGDWPKKLSRVVTPVVRWPMPEQNWAGEPVAFVSAQVGYPDTNGAIMWTARTFQKTDAADPTWNFQIEQKRKEDVANAPANWEPDQTFVKRRVHLLEPPSEAENPFVRVQVDRNVIDLDPGPNGTLVNDVALEVRADNAGKISVGPMALGVMLEDPSQVVEVTFEATDESYNPTGRAPVTFRWNFNQQDEPRFWSVFTGDPETRPYYRYKVRVIVKGSLLRKGQEWEGPWENGTGNGPLTVRVPMATDAGVTTRTLELPMSRGTGVAAAATRAAEPLAAASRGREIPGEVEVGGGYRVSLPLAHAGEPAAETEPAAYEEQPIEQPAAAAPAAATPRARARSGDKRRARGELPIEPLVRG